MTGSCSACGQRVELVDVRLDQGLVLVRCPACGSEQRLSLAAAPTAAVQRPGAEASPRTADVPPGSIDAAVEPPAGVCPKCISPRPAGAAACSACGLVFANFRPADHEPPAAVLGAWRTLAARWGQAAEHTRFLQLAGAADGLAAAGRLYRIRLAQSPGDALAQAGVEATLKMASAPVAVAGMRRPESAPPRRRRWTLAVAAMVLLLPVAAAFVLLRLLGGH